MPQPIQNQNFYQNNINNQNIVNNNYQNQINSNQQIFNNNQQIPNTNPQLNSTQQTQLNKQINNQNFAKPIQNPNTRSRNVRDNVTENLVENIFTPLKDFFLTDPNKQRVLASTQDHLDIYTIRDNLVLLKNGDACMVIETTAVNFQLLSSFEQDQKIMAFSDLINSLNFEIQVVIHTEPIDMRRYLNYLEENYRKIQKENLKKQMRLYIDFVKNLVVQNNVLQKRFFLVVPHRSGVLSSDQVNPFQKVTDVVLGKKRVVELKNEDKLVENAIINLLPKRESLMKLISRMGLGSKQLNDQELIQLFYSYYNPIDNF